MARSSTTAVGLCYVDAFNRRHPLPLRHVAVHASLYDLCAEVELQQTYMINDDHHHLHRPSSYPVFASDSHGGSLHNDGAAPLECIYVFPLDEESAVFSFSCNLDGVIVIAAIQEKAQARASYNAALFQGRPAALLEQSAENIFKCHIGCLRPGSTCTISITYLTLLEQEGRRNRFVLPMFVAPKYTPPTSHHPPPHVTSRSGSLFGNAIMQYPAHGFGNTPVAGNLFGAAAQTFGNNSINDHNHTGLFGAQHGFSNNAVHTGIQCDYCLCTPIIGVRYHCQECPDYDLCEGCFNSKKLEAFAAQQSHHATHHMVTIPNPIPIANYRMVKTPYPIPIANDLTSSSPFNYMQQQPISILQDRVQDLHINIDVCMPSPIIAVSSPSHPNEIHIQNYDPATSLSTSVSFRSTTITSLLHDFILLVEQKRCFDPRVLCELDLTDHSAAVSLAFIPQPLDMLSASQLHCEILFIIDQSGSMQGSSIACVRDCLQVLLRSLPMNCLFNLISFGSTWFPLFPSSCPYDDKSLSIASKHVSSLQANLGGTELYAPLLFGVSTELHPSHPRQIFLLTDGQVSNVEELVHLVSQHVTNTRLFTFGIGNAADRSLCKKLAHAGQGKCEFVSVTDSGQAGNLREKVIRQVARAMQPALTDVKVDWKDLRDDLHNNSEAKDEQCNVNRSHAATVSVPSKDSMEIDHDNTSPGKATDIDFLAFQQCPSVAPAVFFNSRFILHALNVRLPDVVWDKIPTADVQLTAPTLSHVIEISAQSSHPNESGCVVQKSVVLTGDQITWGSRVIHTLAAWARIRELEQRLINIRKSDSIYTDVINRVEAEILHLSMKYTLTSSLTSFVAVYANESNDKQAAPENRPSLVFSDQLSYSSNRFCREHVMLCSAGSTYFGSAGATPQCANFGQSVETRPTYFGSTDTHKCSDFGQPLTPSSTLSVSQPYVQSGASPCLKASTIPPPRSFSQSTATPWLGQSFCSFPQSSQFFNSSPNYPSTVINTQWNALSPACPPSPATETQSTAISPLCLNPLYPSVITSPLQALIELQSANGTWDITPTLVEITHAVLPSFRNITIQSLKDISSKYGVSEQVIAMLIALHLLEAHYAERQSEWEMVAAKACFALTKEATYINGELEAQIREDIMKQSNT